MSQEEKDEEAAPQGEALPKYSYGLQIRLEDDDLAKLGIAELPKVGETMTIIARAKVVSASSYETEGSEDEKCCSLQITEMAIDGGGESAAQVLYGKKGK